MCHGCINHYQDDINLKLYISCKDLDISKLEKLLQYYIQCTCNIPYFKIGVET